MREKANKNKSPKEKRNRRAQVQSRNISEISSEIGETQIHTGRPENVFTVFATLSTLPSSITTPHAPLHTLSNTVVVSGTNLLNFP